MGTAAKSRILLVNMNAAEWRQTIAGRKDAKKRKGFAAARSLTIEPLPQLHVPIAVCGLIAAAELNLRRANRQIKRNSAAAPRHRQWRRSLRGRHGWGTSRAETAGGRSPP